MTTGIEPVETMETEALLELSEELIWAFVRMNFEEVKEIFKRFHDGDFKAGLESALEELETRITPEEFKAHMDRVHASLSPQHRSEE